jgi:hypothetical protein
MKSVPHNIQGKGATQKSSLAMSFKPQSKPSIQMTVVPGINQKHSTHPHNNRQNHQMQALLEIPS